MSQKQCTIET